jgi:hypothetical protein
VRLTKVYVCVVNWRRVADGPEARLAFIFSVKQYEKFFYRNVLSGISSYSSHGTYGGGERCAEGFGGEA